MSVVWWYTRDTHTRMVTPDTSSFVAGRGARRACPPALYFALALPAGRTPGCGSRGGIVDRPVLLLFNTTRTTSGPPRTGEPLSLWTEAWPTHNLKLHRPLVGGGSRGGGAASPSRVNR